MAKGLTKEQIEAKIRIDNLAKDVVRQKYGDALPGLKVRLCDNCAIPNCDILPITTKGEECPYYKKGGHA